MTPDERHARAFCALAHPRRMRLFRLLAQTPACGKTTLTLRKHAKMPEAPFRHHLLVMERSGLVRRQRKGAEVETRLTPLALRTAMSVANMLLQSPPIRQAA